MLQRVLIVDDEPVILLSLRHFFTSRHMVAVACDNLEKATETLAEHAFDLIISDIRLSGMDGTEGLELLSRVKRLHADTPVIMMTAYGSEAIREDAYRRGASFYFEKPIDLHNLTLTMRQLGIAV